MMTNENVDQKLAQLYRQRKQQIAVPEVAAIGSANSELNKRSAKHHNATKLASILAVATGASFGVLAIVNYFAKPVVVTEQTKTIDRIQVVEVVPSDTNQHQVITVSPPLPPRQDNVRQPKATNIVRPTSPELSVTELTPPQVAIASAKAQLTLPENDRGDLLIIEKVLPDYPLREQRAGRGGSVILAYRISDSGEAVDITVIDSNTGRLLLRNAKKALAKWRFKPNAGSRSRYKVTFDFKVAP